MPGSATYLSRESRDEVHGDCIGRLSAIDQYDEMVCRAGTAIRETA